MTPEETAVGSAQTVSRLTSNFMIDMDTFVFAATKGFEDIDFYFAGRGGPLGEVDADVVTAALTFFNPETVRKAWENSAGVMSRAEAASTFAGCASTWADGHLADDALDWSQLGDLATQVVDAASPASAPLFAAWRTLPVPEDPKHRAVHQLNALRELRMARHGAAVVASGIDVADAVQHNTPYMMGIYGWPERELDADLGTRWDQAEALTNVATAADYAVLSEADAEQFVTLCLAANAAID